MISKGRFWTGPLAACPIRPLPVKTCPRCLGHRWRRRSMGEFAAASHSRQDCPQPHKSFIHTHDRLVPSRMVWKLQMSGHSMQTKRTLDIATRKKRPPKCVHVLAAAGTIRCAGQESHAPTAPGAELLQPQSNVNDTGASQSRGCSMCICASLDLT